jgi:hypothetical protein
MWAPDKIRLEPVRRDGSIIGHGQQLAEARLAAAMASPVPPGVVSRQRRRWLARRPKLRA